MMRALLIVTALLPPLAAQSPPARPGPPVSLYLSGATFDADDAIELTAARTRIAALRDRLAAGGMAKAERRKLQRATASWIRRRGFLVAKQGVAALQQQVRERATGVMKFSDLKHQFELLTLVRQEPDAAKRALAFEELGARYSLHNDRVRRLQQGGRVQPATLEWAWCKGECYLRASVGYWQSGDHGRAEILHLAGIHILEAVVRVPGAGTVVDDPRSFARKLLATHCPWGVEVFRFMRQAGLADGLDFSMLEPYRPQRGVADVAQDLVHQLTHSITDLFPHSGKAAPKLHTMDLFDARIPRHTADAAARVIGDGKRGTFTILGKSFPILWRQVRKAPIVVANVVSPEIYEWQPDELYRWSMRAVKLVASGGWSLAIDESIDYLGAAVDELTKEQGRVNWWSGFLVNLNNLGIDSGLVLEKDGLLSATRVAFLRKSEVRDRTGNPTKFVRMVAGMSFDALADFERRAWFEGIEPRTAGLPPQLSYTGAPIPPIFLRMEVFGFQDRPAWFYKRGLTVIHFARLNLAALAGQKDYDLRARNVTGLPLAAKYLSGDLAASRAAWQELPTTAEKPYGRRLRVLDFTPASQRLLLRFDTAVFRKWQGKRARGETNRSVRMELYSPLDRNNPVAVLQPTEPKFGLQMFSQHIDGKRKLPDLAAAHMKKFEEGRTLVDPGAEQFVGGTGPVSIPPKDDRLKALWFPAHQYETVVITNQYTLRVYPVDSPSEPISIPLRYLSVRGADGKLLPATGKISSGPVMTKQGIVSMNFFYPPRPMTRPEPIPLVPVAKLLAPKLFVAVDTHLRLPDHFDLQSEMFVKPGGVRSVVTPEDAMRVCAYVGGIGMAPKTYRGTVTIDGKTYVMWGDVATTGGGVGMSCDIPVPYGRHAVTVTVEVLGVPPQKLTIERRLPHGRRMPDLFKLQRNYRERSARFRAAPRAHLTERMFYEAAHGLAFSQVLHGQYRAAAKTCRDALQLFKANRVHWPATARDGLGAVLGDACFGARDGQGMFAAYRVIYMHQLAEYDKAVKRRGATKGYARALRNITEKTLVRWVALGGDVGTSRQLENALARFCSEVDGATGYFPHLGPGGRGR